MRTRTQRDWLDALEAARRALRSDQHARPGVRRSAGRRARHAASTCRIRSRAAFRRSVRRCRCSGTPLAYDGRRRCSASTRRGPARAAASVRIGGAKARRRGRGGRCDDRVSTAGPGSGLPTRSRGGVARARVEALPARDSDRQPRNHDVARGGDRARAGDCRTTRARARGRASRRRVQPGWRHAKLRRARRRRQAGVRQAGRGPRLFALLVGRAPVQARRGRRSDHQLQARRIA